MMMVVVVMGMGTIMMFLCVFFCVGYGRCGQGEGGFGEVMVVVVAVVVVGILFRIHYML